MTGAPQADWGPADLLRSAQTNWDLDKVPVRVRGRDNTCTRSPRTYALGANWSPASLPGASQAGWGPVDQMGPRRPVRPPDTYREPFGPTGALQTYLNHLSRVVHDS